MIESPPRPTVLFLADGAELFRGESGAMERLKAQPQFFDPAGIATAQKFATSKDGTKVPYFMVGKDLEGAGGPRRALLYGYGGFEISLTPHYESVKGSQWMADGNLHVIANIRGGGEYGPEWHQGGDSIAKKLLALEK